MSKRRTLADRPGAGTLTAGIDADVAGNDWLDEFVPYQLYRVSALMNMRLQGRLKANGINLSQWRVLSVLRSAGRLSLTQIVERTVMEQPTISRVIGQLQEEGLIQRASAPGDSRISLVSLSVHGEAVFDEISPDAVRHQRTALEGLAAEDLDGLRRILEHIEQNVSRDR